ncbi:uncharacterized protein LOC142884837 [Nelusetta ayraudi]|uniref:uncharacterized protein LOC142884837 n=1 Tax=Nelusetta ayraudi TaxID=303726 RepID=UPI003F71CAE9
MTFAISLAFCVFALLTSRSQTRGKSSVSPPALALTALPHHPDSSEPSHPTAAPWDDASQTAAPHITSTISAWTDGTVHSGTAPMLTSSSGALASSDVPAATTAPAPTDRSTPGETIFSVPTDSGNSTHLQHHPTVSEVPLTKDPTSIAPSRPAPTALSTSGLLTTVTAAQLAAVGHHVAPATGGGPAGPTRQEAPSELNVGDEDPSGRRLRPTSPLDPLLAGLLSVFIVTTAFIFIVLFLKFRQRTNHPEFHRLQDLPMDDLMEDTPLSRYTY